MKIIVWCLKKAVKAWSLITEGPEADGHAVRMCRYLYQHIGTISQYRLSANILATAISAIEEEMFLGWNHNRNRTAVSAVRIGIEDARIDLSLQTDMHLFKQRFCCHRFLKIKLWESKHLQDIASREVNYRIMDYVYWYITQVWLPE